MLLFESFNEIHEICKKYNIKNYTINPDGTINVDGDVNLENYKLIRLPKFGEVSGSFYCYSNQLTTLEGAPQYVGGNFDCYNNWLTTLEGAPHSVVGDFDCCKNILTTLEGAPQSVGGGFYCSSNNLTTLEGSPQYVSNDFGCSNNKLITLEGLPKSVGGSFFCYKNPLDSIRKLFPDDNKTFYKLSMEWEFFAGGNKIWKHKFLEAMLDINKELPKSIRGYKYI